MEAQWNVGVIKLLIGFWNEETTLFLSVFILFWLFVYLKINKSRKYKVILMHFFFASLFIGCGGFVLCLLSLRQHIPQCMCKCKRWSSNLEHFVETIREFTVERQGQDESLIYRSYWKKHTWIPRCRYWGCLPSIISAMFFFNIIVLSIYSSFQPFFNPKWSSYWGAVSHIS